MEPGDYASQLNIDVTGRAAMKAKTLMPRAEARVIAALCAAGL